MAKNRYGWQKRAKEIARRQKNEDKMKRRHNKTASLAGVEVPEMAEEAVGDPAAPDLYPIPYVQD